VTQCIQLLLSLNLPTGLTAHVYCQGSGAWVMHKAGEALTVRPMTVKPPIHGPRAPSTVIAPSRNPTATQSSLWRALTALLVLHMAQFDCRFIRGNKRSGFDFELDLEWQQGSSTADAQGTRGTLKVPSVGPDDLDDLHVEVSIDAPTGDGQADEAAWQAAKQLKQPLQDLLEQFLTELRSR